MSVVRPDAVVAPPLIAKINLMPKWGSVRKNVTGSKGKKKSNASGTYRSAKTGRYVRTVKDIPDVTIKVKGLGRVTLKNQGNGTFEVAEPVQVPVTDYEAVQRGLQERNAAAHTPKPQKIEPIYAHFYLKEADGLKALTATKAMIDYLSELGFGIVKILEAEQGSVWAKFIAWWNSEGGEQAREVGKKKAKEGYRYAEQWAKDTTVNKQMADVTAANASSIAALLEAVADQDEAVLHVGNLLVIKNNGKVIAKDLSVPEMVALQKHSGILKDPANAIQMLALVVAGGAASAPSAIES
jgi:hypothetical protein